MAVTNVATRIWKYEYNNTSASSNGRFHQNDEFDYGKDVPNH